MITQDEAINITQALINKAVDGKHTKFEYLETLNGLLMAKSARSATKKVVKTFATMKRQIFNDYIKIINEEDSFRLLLEYKLIEYCEHFYTVEVGILTDIIEDYRNYIYSGHFGDAVFGKPREFPEDNIDE